MKTGVQDVATAASLNLDRITAWFAGRPLVPTRTSRFAALAAYLDFGHHAAWQSA